jgi:hypothetical protein
MALLVLVATFESNRSTCARRSSVAETGDLAGIPGFLAGRSPRAVVTEL